MTVPFKTSLGKTCQRKASTVSSVVGGELSADILLPIGKGALVHHDNAAKGFGAVFYRLCAFHHFDIGKSILINFGRMVRPPLLSGEPCAVRHQQNSVAIHAMYDGFCYDSTGLNGAHAAYSFEK